MIRTILFIVVMYLLIKIISRLFLSSGTQRKSRSGSSLFYQVFRQFQQNQQQQRRNSEQKSTSQKGAGRFEEIEEAEFEDITDEDNSTSKSPE